VEKCIAWYGNAFLESSIGSVIRRLIAEKVAIEVDPVRSGKPSKEVVKNVDLLISWCREFWDQIFSAKENCPKYVRNALSTPAPNILQRAVRAIKYNQESGRRTYPEDRLTPRTAAAETLAKRLCFHISTVYCTCYSASPSLWPLLRWVGITFHFELRLNVSVEVSLILLYNAVSNSSPK
jgi:hypothetical protein